MYSYITHPMWTSPGIVVTRFDASTGTSIVWEGGRAVEYPSFSGEERFAFPEPYGEQEVHLVPHPEPLTVPRTIDVRDVVFKVGYPADETARIRVLLELGFDSDQPYELDGTASHREVRGGVHRPARHRPDRAERQREARPGRGCKRGRPITLTYDFAVEQTGRSASAAITGTVAAIAADLVRRRPGGVHPPEAAFAPRPFIDALAERGLFIVERASPRRLAD